MRIEWIKKGNGDQVILFFNGWGMDAKAVSHLEGDCDVVMFYDYRTLNYDHLPLLDAYREIYVVAWSMGVWAAANVLPSLRISPAACIAMNGTEKPVNDSFGIPLNIYQLTERGMNEKGREKFFLRMFSDISGKDRFLQNKPCRDILDVCEELLSIKKQQGWCNRETIWTKVYISEQDIIFPVENQQKWWEKKAEIFYLQAGHFPFYCFESWNEIIK